MVILELIHANSGDAPSPRVEIVQKVNGKGPWKSKMEKVWLPGGLSDRGRAERPVSHVTAHGLFTCF